MGRSITRQLAALLTFVGQLRYFVVLHWYFAVLQAVGLIGRHTHSWGRSCTRCLGSSVPQAGAFLRHMLKLCRLCDVLRLRYAVLKYQYYTAAVGTVPYNGTCILDPKAESKALSANHPHCSMCRWEGQAQFLGTCPSAAAPLW